jgi:hypothetical protein
MANDFRSYLQSVDPYALNYTGNDGRIDYNKVQNNGADTKGFSYAQGNATKVQDYVSGLYSQYQAKQPTQAPNNALSGLQAQLAALQSQLAYTPKLPTFDVMGNYQKATSQAEAAVNPLYDKYLNDFLAQNSVKAANRTTQTANTKASNSLELGQTLEGNQITRQRSGEDTAAALDLLGTQERQAQQDSGTQFDVDRRALAEQNAAAGTNTSGVGAGKIFDATVAHNISDQRMEQEVNNQKAAKTLLNTRTLDDLSRGDKNAQDIASAKDRDAQFDLDSYLQELAGDETNFRNDNEVKRLGAVADQTSTYARANTQSYLQSLAGAGYRPQDIALAYQVYG